jgi:hypothetical protein
VYVWGAKNGVGTAHHCPDLPPRQGSAPTPHRRPFPGATTTWPWHRVVWAPPSTTHDADGDCMLRALPKTAHGLRGCGQDATADG